MPDESATSSVLGAVRLLSSPWPPARQSSRPVRTTQIDRIHNPLPRRVTFDLRCTSGKFFCGRNLEQKPQMRTFPFRLRGAQQCFVGRQFSLIISPVSIRRHRIPTYRSFGQACLGSCCLRSVSSLTFLRAHSDSLPGREPSTHSMLRGAAPNPTTCDPTWRAC